MALSKPLELPDGKTLDPELFEILSTGDLIADDKGQIVPKHPAMNQCLASMYPIEESSPVWKHLEYRVCSTFGPVEIEGVYRIWNQQLWNGFTAKKEDLMKKHNLQQESDLGRKLLFYGPQGPGGAEHMMTKVCGLCPAALLSGNSSPGFAPKASGKRKHGSDDRAMYFPEHAGYVTNNSPAHRGSQMMIVTEVVIGKSKDIGQLLQKPHKTDDDSLNGTEVGHAARNPGATDELSRQYIIYDHEQAYPHFILKFRRDRSSSHVIVNRASSRYLAYTHDQGLGACSAEQGSGVPPECHWKLEPMADGSFRIVSLDEDQALYAPLNNWYRGVATRPSGCPDADGAWMVVPYYFGKELDPCDPNLKDATWRIVNKSTGAALYARVDDPWKVGAGHPAKAVDEDGDWEIRPPPPLF